MTRAFTAPISDHRRLRRRGQFTPGWSHNSPEPLAAEEVAPV